MTKDDIIDASSKIADASASFSFRLGATNAAVFRFGDECKPVRLRSSFDAEAFPNQDQNPDSTFVVVTKFTAAMAESDEQFNPLPVASIHAAFILEVALKEGKKSTDFSSEEKRAFALVNGIFLSWPYWREYLQNTALRMHLPPASPPSLNMDTVVDSAVKIFELTKTGNQASVSSEKAN